MKRYLAGLGIAAVLVGYGMLMGEVFAAVIQ
jgi:hypothetical protein